MLSAESEKLKGSGLGLAMLRERSKNLEKMALELAELKVKALEWLMVKVTASEKVTRGSQEFLWRL